MQLRPGDVATPLFLLPGVGCDLNELQNLVRNIRPGRPLFGLRIDFPSPASPVAATVDEMAMQAVAEIMAIQPTGPHHLAGYSFGGLVAFAVSQLLCQAGCEVGLLALIGTPIAQRYWPWSLFLTSLAMRTRRQLGVIAELPIRAASHIFVAKGVKFARLMFQKLSPNSMVVPAAPFGVPPQLDRGKIAMEKYRPGFYPGTITLLQAADEQRHFCDFERLWRSHARTLESHTIPADHVELINEPNSSRQVAECLDNCLDAIEGRRDLRSA